MIERFTKIQSWLNAQNQPTSSQELPKSKNLPQP